MKKYGGYISKYDMCIPITIMYQENRGVSVARNVGIRNTESPMVLVLDGDDRIEDTYVEYVVQLLNGKSIYVCCLFLDENIWSIRCKCFT